ncbi:MAG: alpha/beta hydrolase [Proteocatella sp.]
MNIIPKIPRINNSSLNLMKCTQDIYGKLRRYLKLNPDDVNIVNLKIDSPEGRIPIRIYYPDTDMYVQAEEISGNNQGCLIFLHGGGFVIGSIETHENLCLKLARETGRVIISVDYKLAPKYIYPAAIRDCYCVYYYVCKNHKALKLNINDIAIGGASAGGNIALGVMEMCLRRNKIGKLPSALVLQYPVTDIESILMEEYTDSLVENAQGHTLTTEALVEMLKYYIPYFEKDAGIEYPHLLGNPYLSPVKSELIFQYPKVIMISAGKDPLRDDNRMFAEVLEQNGVEFEHHEYVEMPHAFMSFDFKETDQAFEKIKDFL